MKEAAAEPVSAAEKDLASKVRETYTRHEVLDVY